MKTIEDKIYFTVKEFAAAANISDKAVYQQLKTRLKDYSRTIDGVAYICEEALKDFYSDEKAKEEKSTQGLTQVSSQVDSSLECAENDKYISYLEQEIKELKEQLKEKEKTISEMQQQIINLSNTLAVMSNESLQQIASITKNIQLLQVAEAREDIIKSQERDIIEQPKKTFWEKMRGK